MTTLRVTVTMNFSDVSSNAWYAKAVNTLASLGIADVDKKHWAYYEIMEATNSHYYKKDGKVETWK